MRIILLVFIPFLFSLVSTNSPELAKEEAGTLLLTTIDANASTIEGEFCDHATPGTYAVEGLTARLIELGPGTVHESVSDEDGNFTLPKPADGPISYEGILPLRYQTDANLSSPVFGLSTGDLVKLLGFITATENICPYSRFSLDINKDGVVDLADHDYIRDIILLVTGDHTDPYPHDFWRVIPKLPTVYSYTHPDQQFLADYWNIQMEQNGDQGLYPFVSELNLSDDTYVYQNGACNYVDDVIKEWEYREDVDGCSPHSFDFVVSRMGHYEGLMESEYLDGSTSDQFSITCSTDGSEGFYEVIPYDGGFVGVGFAESTTPGNNQDVLVVKMNQYGEQIWGKTIGGIGNDKARTVIETTDGNLFITGDTRSINTVRADVYILKMDTNGNVLWENSFEGNDDANTYPDMLAKGRQTDDGGYIIGARTMNFGEGNLDHYVIKVDASGSLDWSKVIGGSQNDWPTDITVTQDGGYLLVGYESTGSFGFNDMGLLKLNAQGDILWQKRVGTADNDIATNVTELANGHFILNGYFGLDNSLNTQISQAVVMELDATGNVLWTRVYYSSGRDIAYKTLPVNGGFLVMGRTNSIFNNDLEDAMLMKIDANGNPLWQKQYGLVDNDDILLTMHEKSNNEFIMGGFTRPDGQTDWDLWYHRATADGVVYGHECFQSEVVFQDTTHSPSEANTNLISIVVSEENSITSTVSDYVSSCSKVCQTFTAQSLTGGGGNEEAQLRLSTKDSKKANGQKRKARVSIRSKKSIEGFGLNLSIDPRKFAIQNIAILGQSLPMNIAVNKTQRAFDQGKIYAIGVVDFQNNVKTTSCPNLTPVFEIEGELLNGLSETTGGIKAELLKAEFVSGQEMLSPEKYEVVVDWIN